jgi:hypothetical protein
MVNRSEALSVPVLRRNNIYESWIWGSQHLWLRKVLPPTFWRIILAALLATCLACPSILKMEAICSSESLLNFRALHADYIPEGSTHNKYVSYICGWKNKLLKEEECKQCILWSIICTETSSYMNDCYIFLSSYTNYKAGKSFLLRPRVSI